MTSKSPLFIEDTNLSHAWGRILLEILDNPGKEIVGLLVSLTGFNDGVPAEDAAILKALEECFVAKNIKPVSKVAETIFPQSIWEISKDNRKEFFENYVSSLPSIKAAAKKNSRPCEYFERLIAFGSGPNNGNQLEYIVSEYKSRSKVRRSMLQASIFDPKRDHVRNARLAFPCLQHVSFTPINKDGILIINAFYATQQLLEKAYGNYVGLCRLGNFMAHEMGLKFKRLNCFVGIEKLDTVPKKDLKTLADEVRKALEAKKHS
jgi:hypothetical protein